MYDQGQRASGKGGRREEVTQRCVIAGLGPTPDSPSWSVVLSPECHAPETWGCQKHEGLT